MKKFQQWQQNQIYLNHLDRLCNIKFRKPIIKKTKLLKRGQSSGNIIEMQSLQMQNKRLIQSIKNPRRQEEYKLSQQNKTEKQSLKKYLQERSLAYQNYLFGKRILETNSVISKKQLDKQYKLHRKALKTMSKSRNQYNEQAIQKLNQYMNTTSFNIYSGEGIHNLSLKILSVSFNKYKLSQNNFSDISLEMHFQKHLICSQFVRVNSLIGYQFNFRFKKKYVKENKIDFRLRYHKGNSDIELSYFQIFIQEYLKNTKLIYKTTESKEMFKRIGTLAGTIQYQLTLDRKKI